jgi:hypothetical protein
MDKDVGEIFANYVTEEDNDKSIRYTQNIENKIDTNGLLSYDPSKMLGLCNEDKCIPLSMKMEGSDLQKRILIPVLIKNDLEAKSENLIYDLQDDEFIFLGAQRENVNKGEPIPKEKIGIKKGDQIFTTGYAFSSTPTYKEYKQSSDYQMIFSHNKVQELSINVTDPRKIIPRYINVDDFMTFIEICDLSSNCDKTRYYDISLSGERDSKSNKNSESIFGLPSNISGNVGSDGTKNLYLNRLYDFQLEYPNDWLLKTISFQENSTFTSMLNDNQLLSFYNIEDIIKNFGDTPDSPNISLQVQDTHLYNDPKSLFTYFNSSQQQLYRLNYKLSSQNTTTLNGYPAFEFIMEYLPPNKAFKIPVKMVYFFSIFMDNRYYNIVYESSNSTFSKYLPVAKEIIKSLKPLIYKDTELKRSGYILVNETKKLQHLRDFIDTRILEKSIVKTYIDPKFDFTINYYYQDQFQDFQRSQEYKQFSKSVADIYVTLLPYAVFDFDREFTPLVTIAIVNESDIAKHEDYLIKKLNEKQLDTVSNFSFSYFFLIKSYFDYILHSSKLSTLNGSFSAIVDEQSYFMPSFGSNIMEKRIYSIIDGKFVLINLITPPDKYIFYEKIFEEMIKSFYIN